MSASLGSPAQVIPAAFSNKANTAVSFLLNTKHVFILGIQTTTGFYTYWIPVLLINSSSRYIYAKHPRLFSSTVRLNFSTVKIVVFSPECPLSLEPWYNGEF